MATVGVGGSIQLTSKFYDYQSGPLVDPDSGPTLDIQLNGVSVLDAPATYPGDILRESTGVYTYTHTVLNTAATGEYIAIWTAVQDGQEVTGTELFNVAPASGVVTGEDQTLGEDYEINYFSTLDPVFIDPDEILAIFPDAEAPMVLESIYRVSSQVLHWSPKSTAENLSPQMQQYMIAAIACDLSQRYGLTSSDEYSITLGDLSVTYDQETGKTGTGSSVDWCSVAAELLNGIKYSLSPMKGVVRGARLTNPIPKRSLNKKHSRIHLQGTLDDVEGTPPGIR